MTRINVVPPKELCDQHLLAEYKGIFTIPEKLMMGKLKFEYPERPEQYLIGAGHEKFFTNKLRFLYARAQMVYAELSLRGLPNRWDWPEDMLHRSTLRYWNDYRPTPYDLRHNRKVLTLAMPKAAKWTDPPF